MNPFSARKLAPCPGPGDLFCGLNRRRRVQMRPHQVIIGPVVGVMERIAPFTVRAEKHVLGMRFGVVLGVVAFRLDMASPVLAGPSPLVRHAVPYAWVKYLSRHTLPIMPGYVRTLSVPRSLRRQYGRRYERWEMACRPGKILPFLTFFLGRKGIGFVSIA